MFRRAAYAMVALIACSDDDGNEAQLDASQRDAAQVDATFLDATRVDSSATQKPVCPEQGCGVYGANLVCFMGHCATEPPPCTASCEADGRHRCLQDLASVCPECSRSEACIPLSCSDVAVTDPEYCPADAGAADGSTRLPPNK